MKKAALIILDGLGIAKASASNAVTLAGTPCLNKLMEQYAHATLSASGESVGLPAGQMGNSEVGHMNLGAGRIVYQELGRINKAIDEHTFEQNDTLKEAFEYALNRGCHVHLMGLVSDGGVHSHLKHLDAFCDMANAAGLAGKTLIHAFTDGRDTDPKSAVGYLEGITGRHAASGIRMGTVIGRYYAMDRDNRWERVAKAYNALVNGKGLRCPADKLTAIIKSSYEANVTDEFLEPILPEYEGSISPRIASGDVVICFNFRTDRAREITIALTQQDMPEYGLATLPLYYVTMTPYSEDFRGVHVVFNKEDLHNTLGEVLERAGKTQLRIAETEKYPHVTFFFSGGREAEFNGEKRYMAPSPKVATYDLAPEMSAGEVKTAAIEAINSWAPDFICLNFANPDMVGHTGVLEAVVTAVKTVDNYTCEIIEAGLKKNYAFIIIADHGNAEYMANADGTPNTAHTTNLVPCIVVDNDVKHVNDGKLGDIAPTLLKLLGVNKPVEMSGECLI